MKKTFASVLGSLIIVAAGPIAGCAATPAAPAECPPPPPPPPSIAAAPPAQPTPVTLPGFVMPAAEAPVFVAPHGKASIARLADGNNAFFGILKLAAGAAVPEHRDATEEYIYVLAGSGVVTIDGDTYEVGPQSLIYMPANSAVSYKNGDAELTAIQIFAGPAPAAKYDAWKAAAAPSNTTPPGKQ